MLRKVIAASMLLCAAAAHSETESGFYLGAGIGQSRVTDKEAGLSFSGTDTAGSVFGGFNLNPNFAVEAAYVDGGTPKDTIQGVKVSIDAKAFIASLRGVVPFNDAFRGYAKAGIAFWDSTSRASSGLSSFSADDSGNDFMYGLGVEFGQHRGRTRLEWQYVDVEGTKWNLVSLGFSWQM